MIDADRLYRAGTLPVACGGCGWDNHGRLVLTDRYSTDAPPGPRGNGDGFIEAYRDEGGDPDDRIIDCPECGTEFDRDECIERREALIVVDVQRDFIDGSLAVPDAEATIPVIAKLIDRATKGKRVHEAVVIGTADRHPEQTAHFDKWPVHCVKGTVGATVHDAIWKRLPFIAYKGENDRDDGYSGFEGALAFNDEPLDSVLRKQGVTHVTVVGLALDYCVKATALDAAEKGYRTRVPLNATRPVADNTGREAVEALRNAGVEVY